MIMVFISATSNEGQSFVIISTHFPTSIIISIILGMIECIIIDKDTFFKAGKRVKRERERERAWVVE